MLDGHDDRSGRPRADRPAGAVRSPPPPPCPLTIILLDNHMLVPEEILAGQDEALGRLLSGSEFSTAVDPRDEFYGLALRRALLFARWPFLLNGWHELSEQAILYNHYYWNSVFLKLYELKYGFNPDLEEASIQILGAARVAIDWEIIEQIDHLVEDEVARWIARQA